MALVFKGDEHTNDAISAGGVCLCMDSELLKTAAITASPQNAPRHDQNAPRVLPRSGFFSFLYPRKRDTGVGRWWRDEEGIMRLRYSSISTFHDSALLTRLIIMGSLGCGYEQKKLGNREGVRRAQQHEPFEL
jgi:hypothetical protein